MYITYESNQRDYYLVKKFLQPFFFQNTEPTYITERNTQFSKKLPSIPKPDYMPSKLVRISDMKLIRGSEAKEGYCSISYSWNQSGEVIPADITGKSKRIDEGKHKIIFPAKSVPKRPRGRKRIPRKVKFVKFEGIIQQIGKDLNIKYIWFDQMCIDQDNPEEKHREIRNMYKTYTHSYCTVVLVPEMKRIGPMIRKEDGKWVWNSHVDVESIKSSQWIKRLWCLEEALLSSNMLLVGQNVKCRWDQLQIDISIFRRPVTLTAGNILHYAHVRKSTNDHDRVFALGHLFPDVIKEITIDYKQSLEALMIQFYGLLAKKDLSILCFHSHNNYKILGRDPLVEGNKEGYEVPIQKFNYLPSWTGVAGEHSVQHFTTTFQNYTVNGRFLQVTCAGLTNNNVQEGQESKMYYRDLVLSPSLSRKQDLDLDAHGKNNNNKNWRLVVSVRLPLDSTAIKYIRVSQQYTGTMTDNDIYWFTEKLWQLSLFVPITKDSLFWADDSFFKANKCSAFDFRLTEEFQEAYQYVILSGIQFITQGFSFYKNSPVIKRDGDHYKAIGYCQVDEADYLFTNYNNNSKQERVYSIQ